MMTPEEKAQLLEMGQDLTDAQTSPWEPLCLARAFATPADGTLVLTMQRWIDLEALRSPVLQGGFPETIEDCADAAAVFDLSLDGLSADDCARVGQAIARACVNAFAMALKMEHPEGSASLKGDDGFGTWLPLWSFLVGECRMSPGDANALRVEQAYALLAGKRRNDGWIVAGTPYAMRDVSAAQS